MSSAATVLTTLPTRGRVLFNIFCVSSRQFSTYIAVNVILDISGSPLIFSGASGNIQGNLTCTGIFGTFHSVSCLLICRFLAAAGFVGFARISYDEGNILNGVGHTDDYMQQKFIKKATSYVSIYNLNSALSLLLTSPRRLPKHV